MTAARSVTATFSKVFTDATLTPGSSVVNAAHILDLRSAIDTLRAQYGLPAYAWTNTLGVGGSVVSAIDLTEVRGALAAAYSAAGQAPPAYTDPAITAGVTTIKSVHIDQPRSAVRAIE